ncbi:MAG TPA: glycine C-acetyltransferase [Phycisphaerae bacterium]|nr:glycine C-acetyltransferase [Phycisphaerae bacterium]
MFGSMQRQIEATLDEIRRSGLYKHERVLDSRQGSHVNLADGSEVVNFCANNYLGLSGDPRVIETARDACERWGFGLSSVRFICGTQSIHKQLEDRLSAFLGTEDTILYSSCFDANGGLFETLLGEQDAIISDELNHASIIDGIRLCKAARHRYRNRDMSDLKRCLEETRGARLRLIATDGVFSMDGTYAPLADICELADRYDAVVMVDDSHATGFVGPTGRGTPELFGVQDRVDILTSTLGKALGGASGGFTSGRKAIIDLLRQRSRPYLFSNSVAPAIVATTLFVLDLIESEPNLRERLWANTRLFREAMQREGFPVPEAEHPIVPVMLGDAEVAGKMAAAMLNEGIYVIAFSYPVVPKDKARIRVQISAAHTSDDIERAVRAFAKTYRSVQA